MSDPAPVHIQQLPQHKPSVLSSTRCTAGPSPTTVPTRLQVNCTRPPEKWHYILLCGNLCFRADRIESSYIHTESRDVPRLDPAQVAHQQQECSRAFKTLLTKVVNVSTLSNDGAIFSSHISVDDGCAVS